jgi:hypothetical protein
MSKFNSNGMQYAQQKNAWNNNKFMKEYTTVNNPLYPFVYGNPLGYATNTNPDPFFWGQPQAAKYCACGQSLKISQAENFGCSTCGDKSEAGGTPPLLPPSRLALDSPEGNETSATLQTDSDILNTSKSPYNNRIMSIKKLAPERERRPRTIRSDEEEVLEQFGSTQSYGTARQYGNGNLGNGAVEGALVVPASYYYEGFEQPRQLPTRAPCSSSTMIGQHPPLNITAAGGIEYMNEPPAIEASRWGSAQQKSFCAATQGGKKLAF